MHELCQDSPRKSNQILSHRVPSRAEVVPACIAIVGMGGSAAPVVMEEMELLPGWKVSQSQKKGSNHNV